MRARRFLPIQEEPRGVDGCNIGNMVGLPLTFRHVLVALFAAWLPLACCCRALGGEAMHGGGESSAGDHGCCEAEAPAAPPSKDGPADDCGCEGDARVATLAEAPTAVAQSAPVGELPVWAYLAHVGQFDSGRTLRFPQVLGRTPPPVAPTLRALCILITT